MFRGLNGFSLPPEIGFWRASFKTPKVWVCLWPVADREGALFSPGSWSGPWVDPIEPGSSVRDPHLGCFIRDPFKGCWWPPFGAHQQDTWKKLDYLHN